MGTGTVGRFTYRRVADGEVSVFAHGRTVNGVVRALGVICDKAGVQYTCVLDPDVMVEEETEICAPARTDRGEQLDWLLETTVGLLRRLGPDVMYVKKSVGGQRQPSPDRHEVEAVVQVAAHRAGIACKMRTTEQVRAAHAPKAKEAYDALPERPDVKSRSNKSRRERYLYAITAIAEHTRD